MNHQLMSRLGLMREFVLACSALVLMGCITGCPSVVGRSCTFTADCGVGFVCVSEYLTSTRTSHSFCARACTYNAQCGGGIECVPGVDESGFCSEFGSLPEGASCDGLFGCGPGLVCNGLCVQGCNVRSPYRADRACPSGLMCDPDRNQCLPPACDPTLPEQCTGYNITDGRGTTFHPICRRWTNPGGEDGTVCTAAEVYVHCEDGTTCPLGQICDSNRCFSVADAPPIAPERWFPPLTAPID